MSHCWRVYNRESDRDNTRLQQYLDVIRSAAKSDSSCTLFDFHEILASQDVPIDDFLLEDGLHLNDEGSLKFFIFLN